MVRRKYWKNLYDVFFVMHFSKFKISYHSYILNAICLFGRFIDKPSCYIFTVSHTCAPHFDTWGPGDSPPNIQNSASAGQLPPKPHKGKSKTRKIRQQLPKPSKMGEHGQKSIFHWDFLMENIKIFSKMAYPNWFLAQTRESIWRQVYFIFDLLKIFNNPSKLLELLFKLASENQNFSII